MEVIEHTRVQQHHPGRYVSFDRYAIPLSKNKITGLCWRYSNNYMNEKLIQKAIWGELKNEMDMETQVLIIHEK